MDKNTLRNNFKQMRIRMDEQSVRSLSLVIQKKIIEHPAFKDSRVIMAYMPIQNEVMTDIIIKTALKEGKTVCLPRVINETHMEAAQIIKHNENLHITSLELLEPHHTIPSFIPLNIDLLILPGIVFDKKGTRIGFGKGYFDRFIPSLRQDCIKLAPAYHHQVVEKIPFDVHDQSANLIITEQEIFLCK